MSDESREYSTDESIRLECLRLAGSTTGPNWDGGDIVKRAQMFADFVQGKSANTTTQPREHRQSAGQ